MPICLSSSLDSYVCSGFVKHKFASLHVFGYVVELKALMN